MKKAVLFFALAFSAGVSAQCSEIFISEYVEGWSNNKALELYNPTATAVDLSSYIVVRYSNGSTSATSENAVQLSGTIQPYDVFVVTLDKRDPNGTGFEAPIWDSLQARSDAYFCPEYAVSNAFYWNGDDAIVLAIGQASDPSNATAVDIFGKIGEDPGQAWTSEAPYNGPGEQVTKDHSMIRKANITAGVTNPIIAEFNPLGDWDSIPAVVTIDAEEYGNWFSLGEHECDCNQTAGLVEVESNELTVAPNPSTGVITLRGIDNVNRVEVINALGQVVVSFDNSKATAKVDLTGNKGVFFVRAINNAGKAQVARVIVK